MAPMVIVGAADDGISLKLWPSLLGMSHGNLFVEAAEDSIGSRDYIGEGV